MPRAWRASVTVWQRQQREEHEGQDRRALKDYFEREDLGAHQGPLGGAWRAKERERKSQELRCYFVSPAHDAKRNQRGLEHKKRPDSAH
jgi:hypothetical protein